MFLEHPVSVETLITQFIKQTVDSQMLLAAVKAFNQTEISLLKVH